MSPDTGTPQATVLALKPRIDWFKTPITVDDHLERIAALSERIVDHVRFIASVRELGGTSGEAKQRAVGSFCTCMTTMERALSRIGDELRLG